MKVFGEREHEAPPEDPIGEMLERYGTRVSVTEGELAEHAGHVAVHNAFLQDAEQLEPSSLENVPESLQE